MKHNWEYKRLGDVCTVIGGSTPKTDISEYWNGSLNWFTPAEISDNKYYSSSERKITEEAVKATGLTLMPPGTVLLTSRAPIGKVGIATESFYCNQGFKNLICNDCLFNEFLYYTLIYFNDEIKDKGRGATFKEISKKITESISIPVPPMEVQEQIVAELDKINEVIADCRELLRNLDALAQSLFYDTFGDPVTNPKGWPIARMKDITSLITNGTTPKGGQSVYVDSGITFFRSQNVWRNKLVMDDVAYLDEETNASMKGSMLHHNDILITKTGRVNTENSSLGRSALFTGEDNTANINGHVYLVRLKDSAVPRFVLEILLSKSYRDLIRKVCVGAIDKRQLNLSHIEQFPIILPPLALQQQFAAQEERIEEQKKAVEITIAELQTLLDSRMDYWFN